MLFNILINKFVDQEYIKKSVAYHSFFMLLTNDSNNNNESIKRKYNIFKNHLFTNLSSQNEKVKIIALFSFTQKKMFILKRFFYKIFYKRSKFYEPQIDMSLNSLSDVKDDLKITIIQNNTKYVFLLRDLINIINTALTFNSGYFCTPQNIKNPYVNLNFSKANLYNIYFKLKNSSFIMPLLYHRYFLCNFDLIKFGVFNENLIKEVLIKNMLNTNDKSKKINFVKKMLGFFNKTRGKNKKITYDFYFPEKELLEIFNPYLKLFLTTFFIHDENVYSNSKIKLFKKLDEFHKENPTFGRRIIVRSIKKLYYISVLNYQYGFEFDRSGYYIPKPELFDLYKKSIFISCKKKNIYSIFSDKLETNNQNGWDFIKNGKFIFLNEKANKIIDSVIRPAIEVDCNYSTHSSESNSDNDENIVRTRFIDNIDRSSRNFNYYLDTVNSLFDDRSESSEEDILFNNSEAQTNFLEDNDTVVEGPTITTTTELIVNNENLDIDRLYDIDIEVGNDLINELDNNFNLTTLTNEIYDITTEDLETSDENEEN